MRIAKKFRAGRPGACAAPDRPALFASSDFSLSVSPVYRPSGYVVGGARLPHATVTASLAAEARTSTK